MITREICKECFEEVTVGFSVPDHVWSFVVGDPDTLRCLRCFTREADALGVAWDEQIEFFPVSDVTLQRHINDVELG